MTLRAALSMALIRAGAAPRPGFPRAGPGGSPPPGGCTRDSAYVRAHQTKVATLVDLPIPVDDEVVADVEPAVDLAVIVEQTLRARGLLEPVTGSESTFLSGQPRPMALTPRDGFVLQKSWFSPGPAWVGTR